MKRHKAPVSFKSELESIEEDHIAEKEEQSFIIESNLPKSDEVKGKSKFGLQDSHIQDSAFRSQLSNFDEHSEQEINSGREVCKKLSDQELQVGS